MTPRWPGSPPDWRTATDSAAKNGTAAAPRDHDHGDTEDSYVVGGAAQTPDALPPGLRYPPDWRGWDRELAAVCAESHPEANVYPLTREDVVALAVSLATDGLATPIVREAGLILDGRCRALACRLAGVPVRTTGRSERTAGLSRWAYVQTQNRHRRHQSAGQLAMIAARGAKLFLGNSPRQAALAAEVGVSQPRIAKAAVVLEHAADLAERVISGALPLNVAYDLARTRRDAPDPEQWAALPVDPDARPELFAANRSGPLQADRRPGARERWNRTTPAAWHDTGRPAPERERICCDKTVTGLLGLIRTHFPPEQWPRIAADLQAPPLPAVGATQPPLAELLDALEPAELDALEAAIDLDDPATPF